MRALRARPIRGECARKLAAGGVPLRLTTDAGRLVLVLEIHGEMLWVTAATGEGRDDMTRIGLEFIEQCAKQAGCRVVGFSTQRAGLVRKASRLGYFCSGDGTMKKAMQ